MKETVGTSMNGSITVVAGSGTTSMSEALIACQPRIELPSNPEPSSNRSSLTSDSGIVKCCHVPKKSMNFRSAHTALFSLMYFSASFGLIFPFSSRFGFSLLALRDDLADLTDRLFDDRFEKFLRRRLRGRHLPALRFECGPRLRWEARRSSRRRCVRFS